MVMRFRACLGMHEHPEPGTFPRTSLGPERAELRRSRSVSAVCSGIPQSGARKPPERETGPGRRALNGNAAPMRPACRDRRRKSGSSCTAEGRDVASLPLLAVEHAERPLDRQAGSAQRLDRSDQRAPPVVTTSSITSTRSPASETPSIRPSVPCALGRLCARSGTERCWSARRGGGERHGAELGTGELTAGDRLRARARRGPRRSGRVSAGSAPKRYLLM